LPLRSVAGENVLWLTDGTILIGGMNIKKSSPKIRRSATQNVLRLPAGIAWRRHSIPHLSSAPAKI
jgi:hypothetical protein